MQDKGLWNPLRKRGTGLVAMMIVTIGLSIFLRSLYQYFIGGSNHQLLPVREPPSRPRRARC